VLCTVLPRLLAAATLMSLAVVGCYSEVTVRPSQLPKLAKVDRGETVRVRAMAGGSVELDSYKEARLIGFKSDEPMVSLVSPTGARLWNERLWFYRPNEPPLSVDPDEISRAEIVYRDGSRTFIVTAAIVASAIAGVYGMAALERTRDTDTRAGPWMVLFFGLSIGAGVGAAIALPLTKHH
jgi:hypothetical protein